ncbi:hypothetical protein [Microcoleus sp. bin38.metabat.b11b12b14.051]|uniref:hypothetical protein n=1 Tax=Microcoleus sp. bin38.metabat.b11b12b14.051 TaxID=2742709 RepID=UPI0025D5CFDC|nr:hypothetical protein [Microcoleus sp. bin38.metabat.b11b12b14.051]
MLPYITWDKKVSEWLASQDDAVDISQPQLRSRIIPIAIVASHTILGPTRLSRKNTSRRAIALFPQSRIQSIHSVQVKYYIIYER